jgi:hypothetical protein
MQHLIKHNLARAQQRMKYQADKHRQERRFEVGYWVCVKLQPYVQMSVVRWSNQKLSYKYFGPFLILHQVGPVAYKLQMPETSQIHPVIHVSQLKKALTPDTVVSTDVELSFIITVSTPTPSRILEQRLYKIADKVVPVGKVQWSSLPPTWTTWENMRNLKTPCE